MFCFVLFEGGSYYIANTNPELSLSCLSFPSVGITGLHHCILGLNAPSHRLFLGEIILEECVRVHVCIVCRCAGRVCATLYERRSEDNLQESVLSFHHVSPGDGTLMSGSKSPPSELSLLLSLFTVAKHARHKKPHFRGWRCGPVVDL